MARYRHTKQGWVNLDTGLPEEPPAKSWDGPPMIATDYKGYDCPITGKWIEGRAAHRENLKRHGCRLLEKGERQQAEKEKDRNFRDACSRTAEQMVRSIAHHVDL